MLDVTVEGCTKSPDSIRLSMLGAPSSPPRWQSGWHLLRNRVRNWWVYGTIVAPGRHQRSSVAGGTIAHEKTSNSLLKARTATAF